MTQNIVKNIIGNVASSYQVNREIKTPNITKNYINSHVFTCQHCVYAMLIHLYVTLLGSFFFICRIYYLSGELGVNWTMSEKLGMKLAILTWVDPEGGHGVRTYPPPPPGKSHVAVCFLRNTPWVKFLLKGGSYGPL